MHKTMEAAFANVSAGEALKERTMLAVKKKAGAAQPRPQTAPARIRPIFAICLAFILVLGSLGSYRVYETEAALISIDINPSIELEVNRFGRVIGQTGYGPEGEQVLKGLSLKNLTYAQAMEALFLSPALEPYLTDGATVRVTLGTETPGNPSMLKELETCVNEVISTHHQGVSSSYCHMDMAEAQAAHEEGLSMGSYCASHHGHGWGHSRSIPSQSQTLPQSQTRPFETDSLESEEINGEKHSYHNHKPRGCHD